MISKILVTAVASKNGESFGFARNLKNGEEIYIPKSFMRKKKYSVNDLVFCEIGGDEGTTPNGNPRHRRVQFVYDEDGPFAHLLRDSIAQESATEIIVPEKKPEPTNEEIFAAVIKHFDELDFATSGAITSYINDKFGTNKSSKGVATLLEYLHKKGKLACIRMYQSFAQEKASKVVWMRRKDCNQIFEEYFGADADVPCDELAE